MLYYDFISDDSEFTDQFLVHHDTGFFPQSIDENRTFEVVGDVVSYCVIFVSSEIERFSSDKEMKRVIVESGYVCRFPNLVLKTVSEFSFHNIFVSSIEKRENFLIFASGNDIKIEFLYLVSHNLLQKAILSWDVHVLLEIFVDEVLLSL